MKFRCVTRTAEQIANGQQPFINQDDGLCTWLVAARQFVNQSWAAAGIIRAFGFAAIQQCLRVTQRNFIAV